MLEIIHREKPSMVLMLHICLKVLPPCVCCITAAAMLGLTFTVELHGVLYPMCLQTEVSLAPGRHPRSFPLDDGRPTGLVLPHFAIMCDQTLCAAVSLTMQKAPVLYIAHSRCGAVLHRSSRSIITSVMWGFVQFFQNHQYWCNMFLFFVGWGRFSVSQ